MAPSSKPYLDDVDINKTTGAEEMAGTRTEKLGLGGLCFDGGHLLQTPETQSVNYKHVCFVQDKDKESTNLSGTYL